MVIRLLTIFCFIYLAGCEYESADKNNLASISITQSMGGVPDAGFTRALEVRQFEFPVDHAAHLDFATEWWYFTGNLSSENKEKFGYQLTLFRVGLKPGQVESDSDWRSHQLYMGHLAISDINNQQHVSSERFARSAAGLSGAEQQPLRIWLGSWSIDGNSEQLFPLHIKADTTEIAIDFTLQAGSKPIVLQGDKGLSRKGASTGNASYYYSYTRLPTQGTIRIKNRSLQVSGNSWFDREWSSSALADDQAGWDWFSLQLDDGRDLMFYRMRDKQGRAQIFSNGVLVETDGSVHPLTFDQVALEPLKVWKSDQGASYPVNWSLKIPQYQIDLRIEAAFDDQEMRLTVIYWEGAVSVSGSHNGVGYLELSGY